MDVAAQTVVRVFLKSSKGKESLGKKEFHSLVSTQLKNVLSDSDSKEAVDKLAKDLDGDKDGKVDFQGYMKLVGYLATNVSTLTINSKEEPQQNARSLGSDPVAKEEDNPQAEAKANAEPKAEPKEQTKPEEPETKTEPEAKPEANAEPKEQTPSDADTKPKEESAPKTEVKPEVNPEPKTEEAPAATVEAKADATAEAQVKDNEVKAEVTAEATVKTEAGQEAKTTNTAGDSTAENPPPAEGEVAEKKTEEVTS